MKAQGMRRQHQLDVVWQRKNYLLIDCDLYDFTTRICVRVMMGLKAKSFF
jgi:hypothetical protein